MRAFRLLLRLYPASFRHEYGGELATLFAEQRLRATGPLAVAALWFSIVAETIGNAAALHWELLAQDLRYAGRTLRAMPGFAVTAIMVAAIGIGANAAAFSVADFALVRPLPFPHPDRLVALWEDQPEYSMMQPSPLNYHDWRASATVFDGIGAYHDLNVAVTGGSTPQQISGTAITGQLFQLLGAHAAIGRLFTADEEESGAAEVVLGYALWRDAFGADRNLIGKTILLDGTARVVVGVMPADFAFPDRTARLWTPMTVRELTDPDRNNNWFYVVGRLKPGISIAAARAEMGRVASGISQRFPKEAGKTGINVLALRRSYAASTPGQGRLLLFALCGAAACVLLIACANLANLLLVRALGRRRELAVRAALGAGRERLVRQLVTESLVLVLAGVAGGCVLARVMLPLLGHLVPDALPFAQGPVLNVPVIAGASLLLIATAAGFGVLPAVGRGGRSLDALREGARAGGGQRARLRAALVIGEVMLSVLLLVSAGLLLRAMWRVEAIDPGFRAERVLTVRTTLPSYRYQLTAARTEYYDRVLAQVRALPGVQSAGYTSWLPMTWGGGIWPVTVAGQAVDPSAGHTASLRYITPGYLPTLGVRLLQGRDVNDGDTPSSDYAAVVSASFARTYWPDGTAIGQHFTFGLHGRTVIGVVADVKVRGPERQSEPQVYVPYRQVPDSSLIFYAPRDLAIRATVAPAALLPAVRRFLRAADPDVPITDVRSMAEIVAGQTASRAAQLRILAAFAIIAIVLAGVGIHGLLAYSVSQRRREIGVRLALGASSRSILGLVMRQSVTLTLAGIIPGALVAYGVARLLASLLAGIEPGDLPTFATAVGLCAVMTLLGSLPPVLRALRVDPNIVMRQEG
jgi:predicted permease